MTSKRNCLAFLSVMIFIDQEKGFTFFHFFNCFWINVFLEAKSRIAFDKNFNIEIRKHQKFYRFSDVFREYRKATLGCNGLIGKMTINLSLDKS